MNKTLTDIEWEMEQVISAINYYENAKKFIADKSLKDQYTKQILNLKAQMRELKYEEYRVGEVF